MKRRRVIWQDTEVFAIGVVLGRLEDTGRVVLVLGFGRRELNIRLIWGESK